MTTVKYSLEEFTHDMESLLKSQPGNQQIFDKGTVWLERLISNPDSIPAEFRLPLGVGPRPNHASRLLYQGESGLQVTAVVWGAGEHLGPHDHQTWGMIGILENALTETRYRRVDDRDVDGYAKLEEDRSATFKPGEITLLIPVEDEIHQMDNHTDRPTVEIHVYGTDLRGLERHSFNLETGKITNFRTTKWDNC
ncbi:MAG: cysteine dioxygenase family protein [Chloroflexi bacterium]|nr:cysteine dioxygenase family protein [Chloroflexota bacterium]MCI0810175.1 cysteine dioxygenase family protein [Chloroflexota bacterium]MCI0863552.1 cysteine dioxygenase family protein [Chloroflexota bacterium]MCI0900068.1 cysteine dioxygenase family protein [Chloroflexota bacterium]MCI0904083.1 cysteine dioxygenase family protein [Chloroflexota bacterium]